MARECGVIEDCLNSPKFQENIALCNYRECFSVMIWDKKVSKSKRLHPPGSYGRTGVSATKNLAASRGKSKNAQTSLDTKKRRRCVHNFTYCQGSPDCRNCEKDHDALRRLYLFLWLHCCCLHESAGDIKDRRGSAQLW